VITFTDQGLGTSRTIARFVTACEVSLSNEPTRPVLFAGMSLSSDVAARADSSTSRDPPAKEPEALPHVRLRHSCGPAKNGLVDPTRCAPLTRCRVPQSGTYFHSKRRQDFF
jgi:hypothetical protein